MATWAIAIGVVLAGLIATFVVYMATAKLEPTKEGSGIRTQNNAQATPRATAAPAGTTLTTEESLQEVRRQAMIDAYAGLEQERRALGDQLGTLKARIWKVQLPASESEALTRALMQGHGLLKDPPLLGAFADAAGIEQERVRIRAVQLRLDEFNPEIDAARAAAQGSGGE